MTTASTLLRPGGRSLAELRLPPEAVITSVLRDGAVLIPWGRVRLAPGDRLQVLTTVAMRDTVLARLSDGPAREVSTGPP